VTQDSRQQGSDPVGDFQRWLMRSGARGLGREVRGNIRKTFGYGDAGRDDVWESATNEPESPEPPECEWCPLCRAARKMRDSGPGLGSHLSSAGDIFASVVQDAVNAFEAVIATGPGAGPPARAADSGAAPGTANPGSPQADPGAGAAAAAADSAAESAAADSAAESAAADAGAAAGAADSGPEQQAAAGEPPERPASGPDDRS
jgi:hypothetical protein